MCKNLTYSTAVTVITIDGTDTLVIDIPEDRCFNDCARVCLVITQTIPDTATINMPVAISIGGDTTTVYPILDKCCRQATACQLRTRKRYGLRVETNATSAVFRSLGGLSCCPTYRLPSIPVATTAVTPAPANVVFRTVKAKTTTKQTDKGVEE
jgi:hypothetical protein